MIDIEPVSCVPDTKSSLLDVLRAFDDFGTVSEMAKEDYEYQYRELILDLFHSILHTLRSMQELERTHAEIARVIGLGSTGPLNLVLHQIKDANRLNQRALEFAARIGVEIRNPIPLLSEAGTSIQEVRLEALDVIDKDMQDWFALLCEAMTKHYPNTQSIRDKLVSKCRKMDSLMSHLTSYQVEAIIQTIRLIRSASKKTNIPDLEREREIVLAKKFFANFCAVNNAYVDNFNSIYRFAGTADECRLPRFPADDPVKAERILRAHLKKSRGAVGHKS